MVSMLFVRIGIVCGAGNLAPASRAAGKPLPTVLILELFIVAFL